MKVESYLFFDGRCEEAMQFYCRALGAKLEFLMRYKESPQPPDGGVPPGWEEKVIHASLLVGDTKLMAADDCHGHPSFSGFSLCAESADEAQAKRQFDALADGGKIIMPLQKTFYSPCFGMLTDRFGILWMVMVPGEATD